jgi:hypothetical protein
MKGAPTKAAWLGSFAGFFGAILLGLAFVDTNAAESNSDEESKTEQLAKETQTPSPTS